MKKIINSPSNFVEETIEGIILAYPDKLKISEENSRKISVPEQRMYRGLPDWAWLRR